MAGGTAAMSARSIPPLLGLLTVEQCAGLLQCSVSTVERLIRNGELRRVPLTTREVGPGKRGPKNWRVRPEALDAFIKSREGVERPPAATPPGRERPSLPMATGTDGKSRARLPRNRG
jgi:hypothetical protein